MDAGKALRRRSAEDAGHEADDAGRGGFQLEPDSMADDSMLELKREAEAETVGTGAVALVEAYSPGSQQLAGAFGSSASVAMDLRLGWDLGLRPDQVKTQKSDEKPYLLIFESHALGFLSATTHHARQVGRTAGAGQKRHLEFACSLELQIERGGRVLFEHPLAALDEPCLRKLLAIYGMRSVRCDQCQFGMTSVDCAGNVGPARKATWFMTNDECIAEAVNRLLVDTITSSC